LLPSSLTITGFFDLLLQAINRADASRKEKSRFIIVDLKVLILQIQANSCFYYTIVISATAHYQLAKVTEKKYHHKL